MSDPILKILDSWADTETSRAVNYMGFGLKLASLMDILEELNKEPKLWLAGNADKRNEDLDEAYLSAKDLYAEYLSNKEQWSKK